MGWLSRKGLQRLRVGRVAGLRLALPGQAQAVEEDPAQLLRRAEVELLAGQLVDAGFQPLHLVLDLAGDLSQAIAVQVDTRLLHGDQHRGQRQLDGAEELPHALLAQRALLLGGQGDDHARPRRLRTSPPARPAGIAIPASRARSSNR